MARFSIGAAWDEMIGFARRESAIVLPVAMATFGVGGVLLSLAMPEGTSPNNIAPGRMLLLLPAMLAMMLGNLSLSVLALEPGTSVADALRRAGLRIAAMIGAVLLLGCVVFAAMIILSIVIVPFAGNTATAMAVLTPLIAILLIALAVPSLLLAPVIAIEAVSPLGALLRVVTLIRGNATRVFAVLGLIMLVMMSLSLIATLVVVAVVKLLALVSEQAVLISLLGDILLAGVSALLSLGLALYAAFTYRGLAG